MATPAIRYAYDTKERLIRIEYDPVETADGGKQTLPSNHFTYDAHGSLTDARVGTLRTHYDYFADLLRSGFVERRIEDADGLARQTVYEMDDLGRMTSLRDSLGAEANWRFNGFDLVVQASSSPLGGTSPIVDVVYDRARRVKQVTETIVNADGAPHSDGPPRSHIPLRPKRPSHRDNIRSCGGPSPETTAHDLHTVGAAAPPDRLGGYGDGDGLRQPQSSPARAIRKRHTVPVRSAFPL